MKNSPHPTDPVPSSVPAETHIDDSLELSALNARAGLVLFAIYSAAYLVFVLLAAFAVDTMAQPTPLGPNVAIVYGFGLIFGAFALALVYMVWCKVNENSVRKGARS